MAVIQEYMESKLLVTSKEIFNFLKCKIYLLYQLEIFDEKFILKS